MIAGLKLLDCGYRVVGSLVLPLAMSEIIPYLAGTLGDCKISQFIHHVPEKLLLFMLILVGHNERSFSLQINITKDITSIVQWVTHFLHDIIYLYITIAYCSLIVLKLLAVNIQPAISCSGLAMEVLEQWVGFVRGWQ